MKELPGKLALVEPGFVSVTALDAASGKQAWTRELPSDSARGMHVLVANGNQLLAWFAESVYVLDATTGARSTTYASVRAGGDCWLDAVDGICARRCDCSFQLASCSTGALLGPALTQEPIEEIDPDGGMSSGCFSEGGVLYGRAGAVALFSGDDGKGRFVAAVAPNTGKEIWHRRYDAGWSAFGHTPDARTCWFTTTSDGVFGVDCMTGNELWHDRTKWTARHYAVPLGAGLALSDIGVATLVDARSGKHTWTRTLPATTLAWPAGAELSWLQGTDGVTSLEVLDPRTGATLATLPFPAKASLRFDAAGFLVASPAGVVAYDPRGRATGRSTSTGELHPGSTLLALRGDAEVIVLDRTKLTEVGRIPAHADAVSVEGLLGAGRIATYTVNGFSVGALGLYAR